ncbi:hypothetical protein [Paracoccus actinidiae]|uniref:hypothetical protein n=1 Tax=Paracoccus actinidiae TaxID=3064531 RepID=UPI0027D22378|nr:hypothetical protein [Paracoccus sp. M09]
MSTRSSTSIVEFKHPFVVPGSPEQFPPGRYEVLVEEELLEGLSFAAYRETGAYLMIYGRGQNSGPTEMRLISSSYLTMALKRDALLDAPATGVGLASPSETVSPDEGNLPVQDVQALELEAKKGTTVGNRIKRWIGTVTSPQPR